jgi:hypothetical protein
MSGVLRKLRLDLRKQLAPRLLVEPFRSHLRLRELGDVRIGDEGHTPLEDLRAQHGHGLVAFRWVRETHVDVCRQMSRLFAVVGLAVPDVAIEHVVDPGQDLHGKVGLTLLPCNPNANAISVALQVVNVARHEAELHQIRRQEGHVYSVAVEDEPGSCLLLEVSLRGVLHHQLVHPGRKKILRFAMEVEVGVDRATRDDADGRGGFRVHCRCGHVDPYRFQ